MSHIRDDDTRPLVAREILDELDMPRAGLRTWFAHLQGFCRQHGGSRHYADLMALIDACEARLQEDEGANRRPEDTGR